MRKWLCIYFSEKNEIFICASLVCNILFGLLLVPLVGPVAFSSTHVSGQYYSLVK